MTQTIPPLPTDTSIVSTVTADVNWVKTHILLLVLTAVLAFGSVYGVVSLMSKRDDAQAARWAQIIQADRDNLKTVQLQSQSELAAKDQMINTLLAANTELAKQKTVRDQQVQAQVKIDATLTAQEAAQRLTQQTKASPGEVTAVGDTVVLDLPISRTVVSQLDILPVAQADVATTQKELDNETAAFEASQAEVMTLKNLIGIQAKAMNDIQKSDAAEIKALKARHRKQMFKFGAICYGAGVATGFLVHIFVPAL